MKKYGSLIALVVVVALAALVLATREKPIEKVKAPYSIAKIEKLSRIEITQPGEQGGLVVLSFGDGGWTLTKPVEAAVADRVSDQIAGAFDAKINSDDITLDASKLDDFGLGEKDARKIALFGASDAPAAEFWLGKTFAVEGTRAKRTYIKGSDGKVYRAQTDLGEILGKPASDLRSRNVQKMDRKAVDNVWVKYQDESKNLHIIKNGDEWKFKLPPLTFELERTATSALVNSVSNLVATGFVDDKKASEVGLDPWFVRVLARESGGDQTTLLVSEAKDGKAYVMVEGGQHIFEIAENTAKQFAATPLTLRARLVKNIAIDDITRIDFGGADRVSLGRKDAAWSFLRGRKGKVKESALTPKITAVAQLRAIRFESPTLADAGLLKPSETISVTTKDGTKHVLLVGGAADEKGNLWAKWADMDLIMVVPQWVKDRGAPSAAELTEDES